MRTIHALTIFILLSLTGCSGSSSSNSSHTSGSIYENSAPFAVSTIAGAAGIAGSIDAVGINARFGQPNGVIMSLDGTTLFVADYVNDSIRAINLSSETVLTIAGVPGVSGSNDTSASGTPGKFNGPQDITTDGTNLYVTDYNNNSIRQVVIATGIVSTLAGSTNGIAGAVDGTKTSARFNGPSGITITPDGSTLYVADYNNSCIRKIIIATGTVTTMLTSTGFSSPSGIICDGTGTNLYLTDSTTNLIRKVVISSGIVSTLAGSASYYGSADGTGSAASFYHPNGITLLGANLYVADSTNNVIRRIVIETGAVTTVAGNAGIVGSSDGSGAAAEFNYPLGITTDGVNLYVGDSDNKTIRKIVSNDNN